ncbi:MAG TPA: SSI family serine proteinase inhibitor [Stackebrandtia sp.]|uniref:SSI family serine proteinase inhibitor n=1 Tax=Stackebrandtia sp. TaxID=2023065 RepID=UPI002D5F3694|nr:SSI family serine proteinase inhibitor [Stackebrandtia sp.]HZE39432.1 SSI family serine proteinase inhibitor [Stackebrandtia sp.]
MSTKARIAGLALSATALALVPATAHAAPATSQIGAYVTFTVSGDRDGLRDARYVSCYPHSGNHPHYAQVCDLLAETHGDLAQSGYDAGPCPMIWDPVTVTAYGHWENSRVHYRGHYSNACVADRATGGVMFDF